MRVTTVLILLGWLLGCGSGEPIVARVGGVEVTRAEFDAYLALKRLPREDEQVVKRAKNEYLERERLAAAIERKGLLDAVTVNAEINEFRKQLLISRYMERYLEDQVTETSTRNYYSSHQTDYQVEKVRVSHILLRTNDKTSDSELQALLTRAHEVHSKLTSGEEFAGVAEQYSEDRRSGVKGGDLGWLKRGAIAPEFSKAVFALAPGEISEPFRTTFGFHIVRLIDGPEIITTPFEAVRGDIRYLLRNEAKQAELVRLTDSVALEVVK